jgi:hypothetical protein
MKTSSNISRKADFILLGDLNCRLDQIDGKSNANGLKLAQILEASRRCQLLNEKNKPTFFESRKDRQPYKSTLDLILTSNNVEKYKHKFYTLPISAVAKHQRKKYHIPVVTEFALKVAKNAKRKSMISSYLYDKAKWNEFYIGRIGRI